MGMTVSYIVYTHCRTCCRKLSPAAGLQVCTAQDKVAVLNTVLGARATSETSRFPPHTNITLYPIIRSTERGTMVIYYMAPRSSVDSPIDTTIKVVYTVGIDMDHRVRWEGGHGADHV